MSGLRLDWYFEQYINMTRTLDYAVTDLDQTRRGGTWTATVTMQRKDEVVMPIDVRLTLEDGSTQWVNIPLGIMQGHKPVPESWIVAEPWLWTFPEYTLTVDLPAKVETVEIDPTGHMPDQNRLNNTDRLPTTAQFLQPPQPSWLEYGIGYRPLVQYAHDFGFGAGLQVRGRYIFGQHRVRGMIKLWPQVLLSGGDEPEIPPTNNILSEIESSNVSAFDGIDYEFVYTRDVPTAHFGVHERPGATDDGAAHPSVQSIGPCFWSDGPSVDAQGGSRPPGGDGNPPSQPVPTGAHGLSQARLPGRGWRRLACGGTRVGWIHLRTRASHSTPSTHHSREAPTASI